MKRTFNNLTKYTMAVMPTDAEKAEQKAKENTEQREAEKERISKIKDIRILRNSMGEVIELIQSMWKTREMSLAVTKFQEGKMWLGMELANLGAEDLNAKRDKVETSKDIKNSRNQ